MPDSINRDLLQSAHHNMFVKVYDGMDKGAQKQELLLIRLEKLTNTFLKRLGIQKWHIVNKWSKFKTTVTLHRHKGATEGLSNIS